MTAKRNKLKTSIELKKAVSPSFVHNNSMVEKLRTAKITIEKI